jgi:hypothetical protein
MLHDLNTAERELLAAERQRQRLTSFELGIPHLQYTSLIWVRDELEQGKLKHLKLHEEFKGRNFNMGLWICHASPCDTIACIGGWMEMRMREVLGRKDVEVETTGALHSLFYPPCNWNNITTQEAVRAIDNYLETGHPKWHEVKWHV